MADILKPEVIWIEGRCYRVNDPTTEVTALQEHDLYENDVGYKYDLDEGDEDDEFEVIMVDNSRFKTSLHVSKHYLGSIIGKKGSIKSRIERDTRTEIKIPRQGQEGDITILGATAAAVKAARRRINIIVISSRLKMRSTHFLSIPMNHPDIMKRFEEFKASVLRDCASSRGLEESLFIKASKLHLTLGVMCLMDNEERLVASKLLTEAKDKVLEPLLRGHLPLKIRLKGLSYMNDDPSNINVLYGTVEEEGDAKGLIQQVADGLVDHFYAAGYMEREHGRNNVKLHVTLLNSKYRNRSANVNADDGSSRNSRQPRETFDGSQVLKKFADFDFGVMEFNDIHLSQRHSMGPDGYYQPTCVVASITT
ncbi:activating signal cointegrator 1 complex subunit 1 [Anticarsia gemmatalis]|uniref:activating signal cointegrator 1 complex subunit 1 n=1 Tax=Anticarsia gemmatalis TaxID=129554 RepID=UPI003F7589EF